MQDFRIAAMPDVEKSKLRRKNFQSQWTVKYRSRSAGQGACLMNMVSESQLCLMSRKANFNVKIFKVSGP